MQYPLHQHQTRPSSRLPVSQFMLRFGDLCYLYVMVCYVMWHTCHRRPKFVNDGALLWAVHALQRQLYEIILNSSMKKRLSQVWSKHKHEAYLYDPNGLKKRNPY